MPRYIDADVEKKVDVAVNSLIAGDEDAEMLEFMDTVRERFARPTNLDDFCSHGERKDGEQNEFG